MLNISEVIEQTIAIADKFAPKQSRKLENLQKSMARHGLKIVVMGDFKSGKSTLINKVFLKKDLLPIDYREATAVPTRLTDGALCMRAYAPNSAQPAIELPDVDAATLAQYITAPEGAERAELADKYSHIDVSMPGILPPGITLVDTPGLNTTNIRVIEGTQKEARDADGIIYVCRAAQLSMSQRETIRDLCGNRVQQFPLHVVLTAATSQTPAQVEAIRRDIEADLSNHGIIARCSVFHINARTERGISIAPVAPQAPVSHGMRRRSFGTAAAEAPAAPATEVAAAPGLNDGLKSTLESFINNEVYRGKIARVARELKPILESILSALELRIETSSKSEEQLSAMKEELRRKKRLYMEVVEDILTDVRKAQLVYKQSVTKAIQDIQTDCEKRLDNTQDAGALWAVVDSMKTSIPAEIALKIESLTLDYQTDVRHISRKYQQDLQSRLKLDTTSEEIVLDMGILSKIPGWLVTTLDYVLVISTSPLPWFADIPLRILAGKLDWLKKFLPASVAADLLRKKVSGTVKTALETLKSNMLIQQDNNFRECLESLQYELTNNSQFELSEEIEAVSKQQLSATEKARLEATIGKVQNWIEEM